MKYQPFRLLVVVILFALNGVGVADEHTGDEAAPVFYPPSPNLPRLQFLAKFATAHDVSTGKSGFRDFVFGGENKEEQAINKPYGVAMHDGAIFVVDTRGNGYVVFDVANGKWRSVTGGGDGAMMKPMNITIDDDGFRYITDTQRNIVLVYGETDRYIRTLGSKDQFQPLDVAVLEDKLYVSDVENHRIHVLHKITGETLFTFGEPGTGPGQFVHPTNIAIGPDNSIYVADTNNFRIQQFTPDGDFIRQIGSVGTGIGHFARPKGVAVDKDGVIYVVDAAFQNVQMFNNAGQVLMFFGGAGGGPGDMYLPTAVDVDYDNVEYFRKYADPEFEIEYLVLVANQFGPNKVAVYGYGSLKE
jgi:DNA-binding beta-propeller fold protein YncE